MATSTCTCLLACDTLYRNRRIASISPPPSHLGTGTGGTTKALVPKQHTHNSLCLLRLSGRSVNVMICSVIYFADVGGLDTMIPTHSRLRYSDFPGNEVLCCCESQRSSVKTWRPWRWHVSLTTLLLFILLTSLLPIQIHHRQCSHHT